MNKIKVSIPGGNGRMGKTLISLILENKQLTMGNASCLAGEEENGMESGGKGKSRVFSRPNAPRCSGRRDWKGMGRSGLGRIFFCFSLSTLYYFWFDQQHTKIMTLIAWSALCMKQKSHKTNTKSMNNGHAESSTISTNF